MRIKRCKRVCTLIAVILLLAFCAVGLASEGTGSITHVVLEIQGDMVIFTIGAYGSALAAGPGDATYDYMASGGVPVVRAVRSGDKFIGIGAYGTAFAQEGNTADAIAAAPAQDQETISGYLVFEGFDGAGDPILTPLFPGPKHIVTFSVRGANGTLAAAVDGESITAGDAVEEGKDIVFTAFPHTGFQVFEWVLNNEFLQVGETDNEFIIFDLQNTVDVQVEFCPEPDFAGGSGTENDPWQIATAEQLDSLRYFLSLNYAGEHYVLISDIDLGISPWNEGAGWEPIGGSFRGFYGRLNGNGFTIFNLTIDRPGTDYAGLFGNIFGHETVIENLSLENVDITGKHRVGSIAGNIYYSVVNNCYATGSITGENQVGGLVGFHDGIIMDSFAGGEVAGNISVGGLVGSISARGGYVVDSHADCFVTGNHTTGGLAGRNGDNGIIENCYAFGDVAGGYFVGGLVGDNSGTVRDCRAEGHVEGTTGNCIGGLVGINRSSIEGSSASGGVTGAHNMVGGLVGRNNGSVANSYAVGAVIGHDAVGGLVGHNSESRSIGKSYAAGAVGGSTSLGGLVGYNDGTEFIESAYYDKETTNQGETGVGGGCDSGVTGLTSEEMKDHTSFGGWDFEEIWGINPVENDGYPFLRWQDYVHDPAGPEPPRDLPFEEDFTGVGTDEIPAGWSRTHTNWGAVDWNNAGGEPPEMRFYWSPWSTDDFFLISPEIDAGTASGLQLAFKHRTSHYADDSGVSYSLQVRVSTDGGSSWDTAWEIVNPLSGIGPVTVTVDFGAYQGETFHIAWVFSGNSYNITDWRIDDIFVGEVLEPVDPVEDEAVAATAVSVGDTLAQSNLSGTFKDPDSGGPVPGNLVWTDGTEVVGDTGQFAWNFTPDNLAAYNEIAGMVLVTAVPDPHVTAVHTKDPGGRASGSNHAKDPGAMTITAKNIGGSGNNISIDLWTTGPFSGETVVTEVSGGTIRVKVKSLDKSFASLSTASEIKAAIENHKEANALVSVTVNTPGIVNTQIIELRGGADILLLVDWNVGVTLEGGHGNLRLNGVAATDVRENPSLSHRIDIYWDNVALEAISQDDLLLITAATVKNAVNVGNNQDTWRYDGAAWTDLM